MEPENILVTGFGPFGVHSINASWEAVKLLKERELDGHKIIVQEIPVAYKYIDEQVPKLWQQYKPKLVVHVGVSGLTSQIQLEKKANRTGYYKLDVSSCSKRSECVCPDGDDCVETGLPVSEICKKLSNEKLKFCVSQHAGRYLCEYIYYTSLAIDSSKTLFVHVPALNEPYSVQELAEGLFQIITEAVLYVGL